MRHNKMMSGAIIVLVIAALIFIFAPGKIRAQSAGEDGEIFKKLERILNNQKAILDGIESLKSELNIVKIRVTQAQ